MSLLKRKIIRLRPLIKPTMIVGVLILLLLFIFKIYLPLQRLAKEQNLSKPFFSSLFFNTTPPLKKYQDRTNIVILGLAGGRHEGANLTDVVLFLSIDYAKKDVVLLSLPRDIWFDSLKDKINTAYHYGEEKKKGGGLILAKATIEEVVGQPIHYSYLLDFSGFQKLIDFVDGVDILVEKGFVDNKYPRPGREDDFCGGDPTFACRYEVVRFDPGRQHMDGERALKYVRTRQAEGEEGSDFARGRRQQQVLLAFKDRIIKSKLLTNPPKVKKLMEIFEGVTKADMRWGEKILLAKFFFDLPQNKIRHLLLDTGDSDKRDGFLVNPPLWQYNGEWVLRPATGDFKEIHKYISCHLENPNCPIKP